MSSKINFKFEKLDYEEEAVKSVVDLFEGVDRNSVNAVYNHYIDRLNYTESSITPIANANITVGERLIENLQKVQSRNSIFKSNSLVGSIPQFTIEMETGTGKTFVYLKTILSLWATYGGQFKKFIIVVPTNPILLGVKKSIEMLAPYFQRDFNINISVPENKNKEKENGVSFVFDSNCPVEKVTSDFIEKEDLSIMLISYHLFNKNSNRLRNAKERGYIVWEDLRKIKPIVIIDEPQKMEGTIKKKSSSLQAIEELEPLMILRYSATHKNLYNQVYKLDSFQAYKRHLVKSIKVKTVHGDTPKNFPYIRYKGMNPDLTGRIEIFSNLDSTVKTAKFNVDLNSSLEELSGGLPQYKGYYIAEQPRKNFPLSVDCGDGNILKLEKGKSNDELDPKESIEKVIEIAIKAHFDKQIELLRAGKRIKALTLFFVDSVVKVRSLEGDGRGEYLKIFDAVFDRVRRMPKYSETFDRLREEMAYLNPDFPVTEVREGYFAVDKNKKAVEVKNWDSYKSDEEIKIDLKTQEDIDRGIDLILNKKDELISFDTKLCFIFSHSALREGWDNPNVFTLVTLKEGSSDISKKQEIGRGLRLPVDVYGNRCYDEQLNELTVIANEYYDDFAEALQKDFNESINYDVNEVTPEIFKAVAERVFIPKEKREEFQEALKTELVKNGVIENKNDKYVIAKYANDKIQTLNLADNPVLKQCGEDNLEKIKKSFVTVAKEKGTNRITIKNGDEEELPNGPQKYISEESFSNMVHTLLKVLQKRSIYKYEIDKDKFVEDVSFAINQKLLGINNKKTFTVNVGKVDYNNITKKVNLVEETHDKLEGNEIEYAPRSNFDLSNSIMNNTVLPRKTIYNILEKLDFVARKRLNNQDFLDEAIKVIEDKLTEYRGKNFLEAELISGETASKEEIFAVDNISASDASAFIPNSNHKKAMNLRYKFDSDGEFKFAHHLDNDENVMLYTKLKKGGFVIETPAGNYSPDWAIVYRNENDSLSMYFIAETKWDKNWKDLQETEKIKIRCAKKHFEAVNKAFAETIKYAWVNSYKERYQEASFPEVFVNEKSSVPTLDYLKNAK